MGINLTVEQIIAYGYFCSAKAVYSEKYPVQTSYDCDSLIFTIKKYRESIPLEIRKKLTDEDELNKLEEECKKILAI